MIHWPSDLMSISCVSDFPGNLGRPFLHSAFCTGIENTQGKVDSPTTALPNRNWYHYSVLPPSRLAIAPCKGPITLSQGRGELAEPLSTTRLLPSGHPRLHP